jgi:hypothetical protein
MHAQFLTYNACPIIKLINVYKMQGLINVVRVVFPDSEHRFCVRHMRKNFQQLFKGDVLKNQLRKIAISNTVTLFDKHMAQMKALNSDAHAWL